MTPDDFRTQVLGVFPNARITSLQRTPQSNAKVGGVPNSDHLTGNAVDFSVPGMTAAEATARLKAAGVDNRVILDEGNHVHWSGPRDQAGVAAMPSAADIMKDGTPVDATAPTDDPNALPSAKDIMKGGQPLNANGATDPGAVYGGAFGDNSHPPQAQGSAYRAFTQTPQFDPSAEVGTNGHPYAEMAGRPVPDGMAYFGLDGRFHSAAPASKPDETLGFEKGFSKPYYNIGDWIDRIPGMDAADKAVSPLVGMPNWEQTRKSAQDQLEAARMAGRRPGKIGEFTGNVAGTLPIALATDNPWAGGALTGASLSDAKSPVDLARDTAFGAAGGKAGELVSRGLGAAIAPVWRDGVQRLAQARVPMTPGQILGGVPKRLEDAATSIPIVGDAIKSAQRRGMIGFARGAVNDALTPIGERLPQDVREGHDAYAWASDKISSAYQALLPKISVNLSPQITTDVTKIAQKTGADLTGYLPPPGVSMAGESMKTLDSELGRLARNYNSSAVAGEREIGRQIIQTQRGLRAAVTAQNPAEAPLLSAIDNAFARLLPVERATGAPSSVGGLFTPSTLARSTKAMDSSLRDKASAAGQARMQDLATAGQQVLPSSVPDGGTPYRALVAMGSLGGAGEGASAIGHPAVGMGLMGAGAAAGIPMAAYSEPVQKLIQMIMVARPQSAAAMRQALTKYRGLAIAGGASVPAQSGH